MKTVRNFTVALALFASLFSCNKPNSIETATSSQNQILSSAAKLRRSAAAAGRLAPDSDSLVIAYQIVDSSIKAQLQAQLNQFQTSDQQTAYLDALQSAASQGNFDDFARLAGYGTRQNFDSMVTYQAQLFEAVAEKYGYDTVESVLAPGAIPVTKDVNPPPYSGSCSDNCQNNYVNAIFAATDKYLRANRECALQFKKCCCGTLNGQIVMHCAITPDAVALCSKQSEPCYEQAVSARDLDYDMAMVARGECLCPCQHSDDLSVCK